MNVAIVRGRLSSAPRLTELDSGDVLVRYEVTSPRDEGPADSVPVSWIGPSKQAMSALEAGDEIVVVGRVRRRWFRGGAPGPSSRTEIAAASVVAGTKKAQVRKAIEEAIAVATADLA